MSVNVESLKFAPSYRYTLAVTPAEPKLLDVAVDHSASMVPSASQHAGVPAACGPLAATGPAAYAGLAGSWTVGDAGNMVCRLDRPSTDSTMPESDFGSTASWLLEKKVLVPSL